MFIHIPLKMITIWKYTVIAETVLCKRDDYRHLLDLAKLSGNHAPEIPPPGIRTLSPLSH